MDDIEKRSAQVTGPSVEVESTTTSRILNFSNGQINDPNVLGKDLLQKALEFDQAQLEQDAVKVRRKLDWIVIPMV